MTTAVLQTWLTKWNHDLRWMLGNCKAFLIVNNASSHVRDDPSNIKTQYLPLNTTSNLQHMDQGVCRSIKCHYRTRLTERHLVATKEGQTPKKIAKGIDMMVAMDMMTASWESILPSLNKNCFCHAGFIQGPAIQPNTRARYYELGALNDFIPVQYCFVCSFLYRSRSKCSRWNSCMYSTL